MSTLRKEAVPEGVLAQEQTPVVKQGSTGVGYID